MEIRDFIFAVAHYVLTGLCLWSTIKTLQEKRVGWGSYGITVTLFNLVCAICYTASWIN